MVPTESSHADGAASLLSRQLKLALTFLRDRPLWCTWLVTRRCNYRCAFCNRWQPRAAGRELTLDEIARAARKLAQVGTMMVGLAGGEPFLRPDFADIVRVVSRYHLCYFASNGSLITRRRAREVIDAGLWGAGVSIDYADADRHDAHRGVKGAHDRAVSALKYLSEERNGIYPQIKVMTALMHDNLDDLPRLAALAREHDADLLVQPYSLLKTGDEKFVHRAPVARKLLRLKAAFPNLTSNPVFLERFDTAITEGVKGCIAGRYLFCITAEGGVTECDDRTEHPVGSILTDDFPTLFRRLRERHRRNTCRACWYNCRGEVEVFRTLRGMLHSLAANFVIW